MANNRMWLLHRPTGKAVFLAKRMGDGWYTKNDALGLNEFFDHLQNVATDGWMGDDFVLAMEDCTGAPGAFNDWRYTADEEPFRVLELVKK